jgi:hypothetical protein
MVADTRFNAADDPDAPDPLLRPAWEDTPDETDADRRRRGRARSPCPAKDLRRQAHRLAPPDGRCRGPTATAPWHSPRCCAGARGPTLGSPDDLFKIVG